MKYLAPIAAAAIAVTATAQAGTLTEPVIAEAVPEVEQSSSSTGIIVPLLLLLAVGALISSSDDSPAVPGPPV
jgi:hypothetical protein